MKQQSSHPFVSYHVTYGGYKEENVVSEVAEVRASGLLSAPPKNEWRGRIGMPSSPIDAKREKQDY